MSTASSNNNFIPFKFKDLKIYSSTEWLADNQKKYRQVFDKHETSYVYTELSLYNKLFDEDDWEINVELKCFSSSKGQKELCSLPFTRKVSKYDNLIFIREGWGNKNTGSFWTRGTYFWEAWVEGKKVATKYFYIEDGLSPISYDYNPYVNIQGLSLYEGSYDDIPSDQRIYHSKFDGKETRYVYADIKLDNLLEHPWQCELFIKFYNEAKELKGQVIRLQRVNKEDDTIEITAGWGSNVKGSWREGRYTCEIIFMDRLLATMPFEVSDYFEQGNPDIYLPFSDVPIRIEDLEDRETFEEVLAKLNLLIGLQDIKTKVFEHSQYIKFLQLRKKKGIIDTDHINIHSVFMGNPGTGKTSVAKMMGRLYKKMGLLSKGHVYEVDRVDLVGEYIGQTAPKVREAIERAQGGVLFIDEAYSLARNNDDAKDFGREVIEILIKEMSNPENDMAVIVAGYPKEMKHFIDSNPGLKSRFKLFYDFPDYLPTELSEIAEYACNEMNVVLSPKSKEKIDILLIEAYRNRDKSFGNARYVFDIIEKAKINLGIRVMESENPDNVKKNLLSTIQVQDLEKIDFIRKPKKPNIPIDNMLLEEALKELDQLIGMNSVKKEIHELVDVVSYYKKTNKNVLNKFFLHTVFVGNPGTGKTTVARIITRIYKALGILERGHIIETDRQGLVAGFVGQTAIKTNEKIAEALGGVLFIDEAYALTSNHSQGDFGNEAIQTILKQMEDSRGQFFVFVAGYPDQMEKFLEVNPGFKSRFDKILKFENYNVEELLEIGLKMIKDEEMFIDEKAQLLLSEHLQFIYSMKDKNFGNARTVRQLITEIIHHQNLRIAQSKTPPKSQKALKTILPLDLSELSKDKNQFVIGNRATIGYKN